MALRRSLVALLAVPALALAGCGGGSSVADPPVSTGPTSSSPTTSPPAHETPEHFIRRWAAAEKQMENTGKTDAYLAMSDGCHACQTLAKTVSGYYAHGGYVHWGGWRISWIRASSRNNGMTTFAVRNRSMPTTYRESSIGPSKHLIGGVTTELITLKGSNGGWLVTAKAEQAS